LLTRYNGNKKAAAAGFEWRKHMARYICSICGYVYDEAQGEEDSGIAPGTLWEDVPEDFVCPVCGATKDQFEKED
jgi:rubredoxin